MKHKKFKKVEFDNKKRVFHVEYTSGLKIDCPYFALGIKDKITEAGPDPEVDQPVLHPPQREVPPLGAGLERVPPAEYPQSECVLPHIVEDEARAHPDRVVFRFGERHRVGDCVAPRGVQEAIHEAERVARAL